MAQVILLERDDVDRIGLTGYWFNRHWEPDDPEGIACDFADLPDPGPFLLRVNDEQAWVKRSTDPYWFRAGHRARYPCDEQRQWSALFDLYAEGIGISPATLRNRFMGMRRRLKRIGRWARWEWVYPWPEGGDLVWSSLVDHPWLETRELNEKRQVRYVPR